MPRLTDEEQLAANEGYISILSSALSTVFKCSPNDGLRQNVMGMLDVQSPLDFPLALDVHLRHMARANHWITDNVQTNHEAVLNETYFSQQQHVLASERLGLPNASYMQSSRPLIQTTNWFSELPFADEPVSDAGVRYTELDNDIRLSSYSSYANASAPRLASNIDTKIAPPRTIEQQLEFSDSENEADASCIRDEPLRLATYEDENYIDNVVSRRLVNCGLTGVQIAEAACSSTGLSQEFKGCFPSHRLCEDSPSVFLAESAAAYFESSPSSWRPPTKQRKGFEFEESANLVSTDSEVRSQSQLTLMRHSDFVVPFDLKTDFSSSDDEG